MSDAWLGGAKLDIKFRDGQAASLQRPDAGGPSEIRYACVQTQMNTRSPCRPAWLFHTMLIARQQTCGF